VKFIFAGTTEFGIPTIEKLIADGHELLLCITQPDKPTGRKQELSPPPIKLWAQKNNIRVLQPTKVHESIHELIHEQPDLLLVAAYGQIIPKEILSIPKFGSVNIHGSVLPKYRGASPIQAAILNGDKTTGITLIVMDEKMDHGPILAIRTISIEDNDNFATLYKKLAALSAELTSETLPKFISGETKPHEQNETQATFTKLLKKEDAKIDWTRRATEIRNQIRALNPEPGTWTTLDGKNIKISEVQILNESKIELPGKLYRHPEGLAVKTTEQSLLIQKIQPEGKNPMSGKDYLNGLKTLDRLHFV
jgi:methionyl-tRNA formyltransferase